MSPGSILLLAALTALVLAGARTGFGNRALPAFLRPLVDTGTVFILVGVLLGPFGANVFTAGLLEQFTPVIVIGLGWIGFLYGSHLEWRLMRRYPPKLYAASLLQALVVFAVVSVASWGLLTLWLGTHLPLAERVSAALILGVCATGTAPAGVFHLNARAGLRGDDLNALRFIATVDDLPALVLLGVMGAFLRPPGGEGFASEPLVWLGFTVGIGVGLGFITHWLFPRQDDVRHNTLVLLGIVSLGAGAAVLLRISPLFVTTLAGITFANLSPRKERAYGLLANSEQQLYVVFLLVAGLLFRLDASPLYVLVPAYLLLRGLGKLGGGWAAQAAFLRDRRVSPLIGGGLLFQGGMALAMAVSFQRTHLAQLDSQVTTSIVVGVVVFELIAPSVAVALLSRRPRR